MNITYLNLICSALGGTTTHKYEINALNEWCTLLGGTGGHKYNNKALNELVTLYGGSTTYPYDIEAYNAILVLLGETGGYKYLKDALIALSGTEVNNLLPTLNLIIVDLGGVEQTTKLAALNEICTLVGGVGNHATTLDAVNELCTLYSAETTLVEFTSLQNLYIALGGVGSFTTELEYWSAIQQGGLLNDPDYMTIYNAMTVKPSIIDKANQSKLVRDLKTAGVWNKAELLDIFCAHSNAESLFNWKNPLAFNPTKVNTPEYRAYQGFRGTANGILNLNFNLATQGIAITKDNICIITAIADDRSIDCSDDFGALGAGYTNAIGIRSRSAAGNAQGRLCSNSSTLIANTNAIKYYTQNRSKSTDYDIYINKVKTNTVKASTGLPDNNLYALGINNGGTTEYGKRMMRFLFVFTALTEAEIFAVIDAMESYLANYKANIIGFDNYIAKPYKETKSVISLTTYDGSGETVHPSVVNIGSAWNGYQYWMANTPYPGSNSALENPSIWASNDGSTWVVPSGLTNPVVPYPGAGGFNADTELFFENNTLYMAYKYAMNGVTNTRIISSTDGITWTQPKIIISPLATENENTCPSIIKIGSLYYIYYFANDKTTYANPRIMRASCSTIDGTYGNQEVINMPTDGSNIWWHFDIEHINNAYYFVAISSASSSAGKHVYILKSLDGVNFEKSAFPVLWAGESLNERDGFYRPCIAIIGTQPTLYYTTLSDLQKWGLSKINIDLN